MWMYTKSGKIFGPVSLEEIVNQINAGVINAKTAVYRSGGKIFWAGEHPELKEYFTKTPPAAQTPPPKPSPAPAPTPAPSPAPASDLKSEMIASLNKEAAEAFAKKDYATAISDLESILELNPGQADAQTMLDICKKKLESEGKSAKKTASAKKTPVAKKTPPAKKTPAPAAPAAPAAPVAPAPLGVYRAGIRDSVTVNGIEFSFRWCPSGLFIMGSPESEEGSQDEEVPHLVTLTKGFWMMETEVTVGMFKEFVNSTGYISTGATPLGWTESRGQKPDPKCSWLNPGFRQSDSHPVTCISWFDADLFCKWLSNMLSQKIQLPTEAQWEYACRADTITPYFWGDSLNGNRANCDGTKPCGMITKGCFYKMTTPVGSYSPNAWGLYDMHGNVWEWCQDWTRFYPSEQETDPIGPLNGRFRVMRGGGWDSIASDCRSASRLASEPDIRCVDLGFRCVRIE